VDFQHPPKYTNAIGSTDPTQSGHIRANYFVHHSRYGHNLCTIIRSGMKRRFNHLFLSLVCCASLLLQCGSAHADSETRYSFSFKTQPLASALKVLAEQANVQLLFSSKALTGLTSPEVSGTYTVAEVLDLLLVESGLEFVSKGAEIIAIRQKKEVPPAEEPPQAPTTFVIEEVQVTARKVAENLQDTPVSVAVHSGVELEMQQVHNVERLGYFTPNLQLSPVAAASGHNAAATIFMRGIGQTDFIPSTDPGVGLYVDGLYYARTVGASLDIMDIERIEVLRGPQGTLFGRNTIGGAILVHTHQPNKAFGGRIKAKVSNDNGRELLLNLNAPITETLSSRFVLARRLRDGYVTRISDGLDLGDDDTLSARARFSWSPEESTQVSLALDYSTEDENGAPQVFNSINTSALFPIYVSINAGCPGASLVDGVPENRDPRCANNQYQALGPYKVNSNGALASELDTYGIMLAARQQIAWAELSAVLGYRRSDWFADRDADNTPLTILHTRNDVAHRQYSGEINISGDAYAGRLHWLMGVYYFQEEADEDYPVFLPEPQVGANNTAVDLEIDSRAVFGQLSVDLTSRLNITAGLRVTREKKHALPINGAELTGPGYNVANPLSSAPSCMAMALPDACIQLAPGELLYDPVPNRRSDTATTPLLNLSYRWPEQIMGYISYAEGFKSGGFSTRISRPVPSPKAPTGREFLPEYDSEIAKTTEIGLKSTLLDGNLLINVALFKTEYKDVQLVARKGIAPVLLNAGEADIEGLELEWEYLPLPKLRINGGVGIARAEYSKLESALSAPDADPLGAIDLDNELAHTPKFTASLGMIYAVNGQWGTLTPRLDLTYQSKIFFDAQNTEAIAQPSYTLLNAALSYRPPQQAWKVTLAGYNLTDERYRVAGNSSLHTASGYAESTYARPREWSLAVEYQF